jgi:hypothetical protein
MGKITTVIEDAKGQTHISSNYFAKTLLTRQIRQRQPVIDFVYQSLSKLTNRW